MGYQALLFCPDEKLARVVGQVFSELDFTIDAVQEPFAAVKQLMAQHYDVVVVDCDNEQNASLLFRSARNSSSNQSSLAFAIVEGQTGVAKAYRIGANLVLTKPINLEQAKGTLRVARGLLRKSSDAAVAGSAMAAASAMPLQTASANPVPEYHSTPESSTDAAPIKAAPRRAGWSNFATPVAETAAAPVPAAHSASTSASAEASELDEMRAIAAAALEQNKILSARTSAVQHDASLPRTGGQATNEPSPNEAMHHDSEHDAEHASSRSAAGTAAIVPSGMGTAAAPAKEITSNQDQRQNQNKDKKTGQPRSSALSDSPAKSGSASISASTPTDAPSFAGLGDEQSSAPDRNKKLLIAAVVILALGVLGYFGEGKFGKSDATASPDPAASPQNSAKPAPALAPMSAPATPSPSPSDVASLPNDKRDNDARDNDARDNTKRDNSKQDVAKATNTTTDKPSVAVSHPSIIRMAENAAHNIVGHLTPGKPAGSTTARNNTNSGNSEQAQSDDPSPPSPATLTLASANDRNLSSLMSPASINVARPSLSTLKVSQGVSQGLLIKRVQPKYPPAALAVHAQGAVLIEATVNKEGSVVSPKVISGDPILARAAVDAVRQWRYKPYYLDGNPVEIQTQITINFKAN